MVRLRKVTFFGKTFSLEPLALLISVAVILRIPSLFEPYWYGDEGIYLTLGEALRRGLVWYRDIHDNKPPLLYLLAAITGSVFWFRFLLLVWHTATVILFWKLAERFFPKNNKAIILSSVLFTLLTTIPLLEGNIANAEIFMIGPTIAGMLLILSEKLTNKRIFAAGLLFSIATLFKIPAAFDMLAVVAFWGIAALWDRREIWESIKKSVVLGIGFLVPIFLTLDYYWWAGALAQYLRAAFGQNIGYLASWGISTLPFRAVVLALVVLLIFAFKKYFGKLALFASLWFIFATFAMLLSGRPYPHYVIQAVPPLSILVAILAFGRERFRFLPVPLFLLFLASLVFYKFYYFPTFSYYQNFLAFATGQKTREEYFRNFDNRVPRTYKLAEFIASRTTLKDKVFIWGTEPEVYALSRRLPPGRYVASYHIADFGTQAETLHALESQPPKYIIVIQEERRDFPGFFEFLAANYIFLENVNGAEVWRLRLINKVIF